MTRRLRTHTKIVKAQRRKKTNPARKGSTLKLAPKPITIYDIFLELLPENKLAFKISCSKGTYIRSIARDFGDRLKCGAVLSRLRRTKIGDYDVENALRINNLVEKIKEVFAPIS